MMSDSFKVGDKVQILVRVATNRVQYNSYNHYHFNDFDSALAFSKTKSPELFSVLETILVSTIRGHIVLVPDSVALWSISESVASINMIDHKYLGMGACFIEPCMIKLIAAGETITNSINESSCKNCSKKNDVGIKSCWWCGCFNPC